jgi:hypothetical protein
MNSRRSFLRSGLGRLLTKNMERIVFLFFVLSLSVVAGGAEVNATRTEPAMQCADTSKRSQGDVVVTNTCDFKITVQTSMLGTTQLVKNLDPAGSSTIEGSAHSPWRVFACTWPGAPADQAGKEVAYATEKYECAVKTASAQAKPSLSQPGDETKAEQEKLYGGAHPYMDEALPELKKTVHELGGLKAVPLQEPLPDLLAKVGAKADELLHKVPDLISDEAVSQTSRSLDQGLIPGCVGTSCFNVGTNSGRDQTFNYLILTHPAPDGRLSVQEYRTGGNGQPVQGAGAPNFQGFISSWIIFSSANQVESHFRYLGEQKTDGHNTLVIGFAQIPGSVESPGQIMTDSRSVPMFLQGVAWIDQSDFSIVRLRTDLLAPQPEVLIQRQTASILFGPVHIPTVDLTLWLPQVVHVEMESRGQLFQEQHKYSKYRLYQAKSKIILSPQ